MKGIYTTILIAIMGIGSLMIGCGGDDGEPSCLGPGCSGEGSWEENISIDHDGHTRYFDLYTPSGMSGNRPLVIVLHGHSGTKDDVTSCFNNKPLCRWRFTADLEKFYVAAPDGLVGPDYRGWNDCRPFDEVGNPGTDDVGFLEKIIIWIDNNKALDVDRVFITGHSNGGHMSIRMALESSVNIAAIGAIAGSLPIDEDTQCGDPAEPVGVLIMNGTEDKLLPYNGGPMIAGRGVVKSTSETINYFIAQNNANSSTIISIYPDINKDDSSAVKRYTYTGGDNGTQVNLYKITGGGHAEPSIQQRYTGDIVNFIGPQNGDIESSEEIWNFFKTQRK
jgi:polyhydroxybutyrate depolymerase